MHELVKEEDAEYKPHVLPETSAYMDVLPEMVGYVLGARGATVKMLKEKTRAQIQITGVHNKYISHRVKEGSRHKELLPALFVGWCCRPLSSSLATTVHTHVSAPLPAHTHSHAPLSHLATLAAP